MCTRISQIDLNAIFSKFNVIRQNTSNIYDTEKDQQNV